jgi:hypothetical protein
MLFFLQSLTRSDFSVMPYFSGQRQDLLGANHGRLVALAWKGSILLVGVFSLVHVDVPEAAQ